MPTYQRFIFDSYHLDQTARTITLRYSLDDAIHFQEVLTLPAGIKLNYQHPDLEAALFALHLSGGVSYYKTYCPLVIEVRSGQLTAAQAGFWNKLYTHGLGQFFYENLIDFHDLIKFPVTAIAPPPSQPSSKSSTVAQPVLPQNALVPFGGGKDSIVTTELLRAAGIKQTLFRLRPHHLITELAGIAGLPLVEAGRTLAPELFSLNQSGAYNGHVPITAHISFFTIVLSLLAGYDSVFFSSERSSSYGNVDYLGMEVNHQWSKSLEAEFMLAGYIKEHITTDVKYLNVIRPLSELHIANIFTHYPQYFHTATSCNRNWVLAERTTDAPRWCGHCPKCAFSFSLLAAYLPRETVVSIFDKNLFDNPNLLSLYQELWGVNGFKPFECVGTPEEAQAAFYLAHKQGGYDDTALMKEFTAHVLPTMGDPNSVVKDLLTARLDSVPKPTITSAILESAGVLETVTSTDLSAQ